jgi:hypothetical protein
LEEPSQNSVGRYADVAQIRLPNELAEGPPVLRRNAFVAGLWHGENIARSHRRVSQKESRSHDGRFDFSYFTFYGFLLRTLGSNPPAIEVESADPLIAPSLVGYSSELHGKIIQHRVRSIVADSSREPSGFFNLISASPIKKETTETDSGTEVAKNSTESRKKEESHAADLVKRSKAQEVHFQKTANKAYHK